MPKNMIQNVRTSEVYYIAMISASIRITRMNGFAAPVTNDHPVH